MRRAIAISMMMLFSWMLIAPLLTPGPEANLPACCRGNGKHHCMMRMIRNNGNQKGFTTVSEKCPCCLASACAVHSVTYKPESAKLFYAEARRHPAYAPQTEALGRISLLRSHQKRGPPAPLA
jgi:hypothetical protein